MTPAERHQLHHQQHQTQRARPVHQQGEQGHASYLWVTAYPHTALPAQHYPTCCSGRGVNAITTTALGSLSGFLRTLQQHVPTRGHAKGSLQNETAQGTSFRAPLNEKFCISTPVRGLRNRDGFALTQTTLGPLPHSLFSTRVYKIIFPYWPSLQ